MTQLKTAAIIGLAAIIFLLGLSFGKLIQKAESHKTEIKYTEKVAALTKDNNTLTLSLAEQNAKIALLEVSTQAAEALAKQATEQAAEQAKLSKSRINELIKGVENATSCDEVLDKYWKLRQ